jgi:hypothetical protein
MNVVSCPAATPRHGFDRDVPINEQQMRDFWLDAYNVRQ